jgi:putative two-component system response regulator
MPFDEAADIIQKGAGNHFDPEVVSAFLARFDEFRQIASRFKDD